MSCFVSFFFWPNKDEIFWDAEQFIKYPNARPTLSRFVKRETAAIPVSPRALDTQIVETNCEIRGPIARTIRVIKGGLPASL